MILILILYNVAVGWDTDMSPNVSTYVRVSSKGNTSKSKYTTKATFLPELQRYMLIHEMQRILHEIN